MMALVDASDPIMRSNHRLHNFTFPSTFLKWGTQKRLKITNADDTGVSGAGESQADEPTATQNKELEEPETKNARGNKRRRSGEDEDEIATVRQKLKLNLKESIFSKREEEPTVKNLPWNLRRKKRKELSKVSSVNAQVNLKEGLKINHHENNSPVMMNDINLRSKSDKVERVKFRLELSKKEIQNDFMEMLGHRPPRRPNNKRPKTVQKKLHEIFPGLWLNGVNADRYKVVEDNENGKVHHSVKRKGKSR